MYFNEVLYQRNTDYYNLLPYLEDMGKRKIFVYLMGNDHETLNIVFLCKSVVFMNEFVHTKFTYDSDLKQS